MNTAELGIKLKQENIDSSVYSLTGGLPSEAYCLGQIGSQWEVYYSERGDKSKLKTFSQENDACQYFYTWLKTSLKKMKGGS